MNLDGVGLRSLKGKNLGPAVTILNRDISEEGLNLFRRAMSEAAEEPTDLYVFGDEGGNTYVEP